MSKIREISLIFGHTNSEKRKLCPKYGIEDFPIYSYSAGEDSKY